MAWKRKAAGFNRHSGDGDHDLLRYTRAQRPAVLKVLDPGADSQAVADATHEGGGIVVARLYTDDQNIGWQSDKFKSEIRKVALACPWVDYWEGMNEDHQEDHRAVKYAEWSIELMALMESIGKHAAVGSFSCGQPALSYWRDYGIAIRRAHAGGHLLALHEYSGPVAQWMAGNNQWNDGAFRLDDPVTDPTARGWLTLRYRRVADELRRLGLPVPRMVITEALIDDVEPRPGPQGKGYKSYVGTEWGNRAPFGDYAEQWRWYCNQLGYDDYVIGAVDFGYADRGPKWTTFDLHTDTAMIERLEAEMAKLAPFGGVIPPPPPPPPPGGNPVSEKLSALLRAEFGDLYDDLRTKLRANPNGPNGPFGPLATAAVDGIAVHHTAGPESVTWESVAAYHVDTRKFAGIGYHLGIRQGRVAYLGDVTTARAHVTNENHHLLGCVMAGNYQSDPLDPADVALLRRLVRVLDAFLGRQVRVGGHRDFATPGHTVCPGTALYAQVAGIRGTTDDGLLLALGKWADLAQARGIQPNEGAALYRAMKADNYYPLTDEAGARGEWPELEGYPGVVPQLARSMSGNAERIYYWMTGRVHKVDR